MIGLVSSRASILAYLKAHGSATGKELRDYLGISRQALSVHLRALIGSGQIVKSGSTRGARYYSPDAAPEAVAFSRQPQLAGLDEGRVYEELATTLNLSTELRPNVGSIVRYAFTEMLNNAIEHSRAERCQILARLEAGALWFEIRDHGIGVFYSIATKYDLEDEHAAMIELLKGKITTLPEAHSGEGIFFTARAGDRFVLRSHRTQIEWDRMRDDAFVSQPRFSKGTTAQFLVRRDTRRLLQEVFLQFAPEEYDYQFRKTSVLIKLLRSEYVSRSQARRQLTKQEKFEEV